MTFHRKLVAPPGYRAPGHPKGGQRRDRRPGEQRRTRPPRGAALGGRRRAGAYSASKGAVASLTYSWALDLEEVGVRVNGVCPLAWTRLVERSPAAQLRCTRERTPDLVAPLITYLLSDLAGAITGQLIRCTGDQLHIVRQPAIKEPVLRCAGWGTEDIAAAFDGLLAQCLEPFGLEKRMPPGLRAVTADPTESCV